MADSAYGANGSPNTPPWMPWLLACLGPLRTVAGRHHPQHMGCIFEEHQDFRLRIVSAGWLQAPHLGTLRERPGNGNPLLLPARQRVRLPPGKAGQIDRLQHALHMCPHMCLFELVPAGVDRQV